MFNINNNKFYQTIESGKKYLYDIKSLSYSQLLKLQQLLDYKKKINNPEQLHTEKQLSHTPQPQTYKLTETSKLPNQPETLTLNDIDNNLNKCDEKYKCNEKYELDNNLLKYNYNKLSNYDKFKIINSISIYISLINNIIDLFNNDIKNNDIIEKIKNSHLGATTDIYKIKNINFININKIIELYKNKTNAKELLDIINKHEVYCDKKIFSSILSKILCTIKSCFNDQDFSILKNFIFNKSEELYKNCTKRQQ
jgi:hypothetical protein